MDLLSEYKELYYKEIEHSERLNNRVSSGITVLPILGGTVIYAWTQLLDYDVLWKTLVLIAAFCSIAFLFIISFVCLLISLFEQRGVRHIGNIVYITLIAFLIIPLALLGIRLICDSTQWYLKLYIAECCISTYIFALCFIFFIRAYTGYRISYFPIHDMAKGIQKIYADKGVIPYSKDADTDKNADAELSVSAYLAQKFINDAIRNRDVNVQKSQRQFRLIVLIIVTSFVVFLTLTTALAINLYQAKAML